MNVLGAVLPVETFTEVLFLYLKTINYHIGVLLLRRRVDYELKVFRGFFQKFVQSRSKEYRQVLVLPVLVQELCRVACFCEHFMFRCTGATE